MLSILVEDISDAFNERDFTFYRRSLSPDFRFVDETMGVEVAGREQELDTVERVFRKYRTVEFALHDSTREEISNGCLVVCGVVGMVVTDDREEGVTTGFEVADETCLTACPNSEDGIRHLTEWRILRSVPIQSQWEVVTWGEVRRRARESTSP